MLEKIILYYKFVPVKDPLAVQFWQRQLGDRYGLRGRVIIADHGINGTLGGPVAGIKAYIRDMNLFPDFKGIEYKWSNGGAADFPRLSVKVRPELVTLAPGEQFDVFGKTQGLRPEAWHAYLESHPDTLVLDARNDYESAVGVFAAKNLVAPPIKSFRDIKPYLDTLPKDQPILTYCTGDIRCEYLSAYMRHKGFQEVYHLDGGIVKYGEAYGDKGFWTGKCFVFDQRLTLAFSDQSVDIGSCRCCGTKTSHFVNCRNDGCNELQLLCPTCASANPECPVCKQPQLVAAGEGTE